MSRIPLRFEVGDRARMPNGKIGRITWIGPSRKHAIVLLPGDPHDGHLVKVDKLDLAIPTEAGE